MLLAIDIGNTSTTFGFFKNGRLVHSWRKPTGEVGKLHPAMRRGRSWHNPPLGKLDGIIISSVVPEGDKNCSKVVQRLFKQKPIFVTYKNAGIKIGYRKPKEIGADRLVNGVAAWERYHKACIVIDFGTATTLDYLDSKGVYWGGPIAPGLGIANETLYRAASKLPNVKIAARGKMLPSSTKEAVQTGVYQGYIGLIERLIRRTIKEVGGRPLVIATGGYAPLIMKGTKIIRYYEPHLILEGLLMIWFKTNS